MLKKIAENLKSENVIIGILVFLIITVTTIYVITRNTDKIDFVKQDNSVIIKTPEDTTTGGAITNSPLPIDDIKVYVVGAVKLPGVVNLKKGQLIDDAVKLAGGFTEDADVENINLVYKLTDNVMLKINSKKSNSGSYNSQLPQGNSYTQLQKPQESKAKGYEIISDSSGVIVQTVEESGGEKSKIININTANKEQLKTLPGIGDAFAERIIQYRINGGGFKTKEELKKVSGIGEAKFNALKDIISIN
jgi:competence protein ComEA